MKIQETLKNRRRFMSLSWIATKILSSEYVSLYFQAGRELMAHCRRYHGPNHPKTVYALKKLNSQDKKNGFAGWCSYE